MNAGPRFVFKNFAPGPNLETFANDGLSQVLRMAPYNTSVEAMLEVVENAFHVFIKMNMGMTQTITNMKDPDVAKLLQRTFAKLRSDISHWRRDRGAKVAERAKKEFQELEMAKRKARFGDGKKGDDD